MLSELVKVLQEQAIRQRQRENELLENIAALTDYETAEAAADIYAAEKHAYSFGGYIYQLEKLQTVLAAGVPAEIALEAADSCIDAQTIIEFYRGGTANADNFNYQLKRRRGKDHNGGKHGVHTGSST